jgi:hypothetical protein
MFPRFTPATRAEREAWNRGFDAGHAWWETGGEAPDNPEVDTRPREAWQDGFDVGEDDAAADAGW